MKPLNCEFITSARNPSGFPDVVLPEAAFVGRSNVGKSSLINAVLRRKNLAKVSATPGKTRLVNYFVVNGSFYVVDLPGYGYARAGREEKESWGAMVEGYLGQKHRPKLLCMLVDSRRPPTELDEVMKAWLDRLEVPHLVVATKVDKLSGNERARNLADLRRRFPGASLIPFSAVTGTGRQELLGRILGFVRNIKGSPAGEPHPE
ncbi:MAG: YihA family ribosome biogenesis GTP-binding protein [Acidobacteria bacterium]|nr:YihA family ribosome biogenesis GTP-binding protein [Acidobacteriota bacterium]